MSLRSLVQLDIEGLSLKSHSLRTASKEVSDFEPKFQEIVNDLIEIFMSHKIAVGLAALQVGIQLKVAIINPKKDKLDSHLIIVNPKVLETSAKKDRKKESCMSLPHYAGEVERRNKIVISYQDRFGTERKLESEGFLARIISHEVGHLEGFLYVDRMKDVSTLEKADIFKND